MALPNRSSLIHRSHGGAFFIPKSLSKIAFQETAKAAALWAVLDKLLGMKKNCLHANNGALANWATSGRYDSTKTQTHRALRQCQPAGADGATCRPSPAALFPDISGVVTAAVVEAAARIIAGVLHIGLARVLVERGAFAMLSGGIGRGLVIIVDDFAAAKAA